MGFALGISVSCALAGDLPNPETTPGLADPLFTKDLLCAPSFSTEDIRRVPSARKKAIFKVYGMTPDGPPCPCEIDHLIPLGIGGSNRPRNLWPQSRSSVPWNSIAKDRLERRLRIEVCSGKTELLDAQQEIAKDWIAAYIVRFGRQVAPKE